MLLTSFLIMALGNLQGQLWGKLVMLPSVNLTIKILASIKKKKQHSAETLKLGLGCAVVNPDLLC